jgi:hypothetical protein
MIPKYGIALIAALALLSSCNIDDGAANGGGTNVTTNGSTPNSTSPNSTTPDACAAVNCDNGGTCVADGDRATCECAAGYEGESCETNIDDCAGVTCENGGSCVDEVEGFSCDCLDGFSGELCEVDEGVCDPNPCQNGGTCTNDAGAVVCACPAGFEGDACETNIDDCANDPCNGSTCIDGIDGFVCECGPFTSADDCSCTIEAATTLPADTRGSLEGFFLGFEFRPTEEIVVNQLGVVNWSGEIRDFDDNIITVSGLTAEAPIALYDENGQIAVGLVAADAPEQNGYKWADITPTTLQAGQPYAVIALIQPPNAFSFTSSRVTYDARIESLRALSTNSDGSTALPTVYNRPGNQWQDTYYGANIGIETCP